MWIKNEEEKSMMNLKLEAPWYTWQKKVKALFGRDPEISIGEIVEPEEGGVDFLFDIEVRDHEKSWHLTVCSPRRCSLET